MGISQQQAKEKIIVALDVAARAEAIKLVGKLSGEVGAFKIGMQLYNAEGPAIVREIEAAGGKVFLDLKFHDIPNTVAEATRVVTGLGVAIMNVHAAGGKKMMAGAAEAAAEQAKASGVAKPLVTAVTVLTSISQAEFEDEVGIKRPIAEQVIHWAKLAQAAGLDGVVASAREITDIRNACGPDFVIITPGIRPVWAAANDQSRIMTPRQAVELGSTYLVIGRPITAQPDPVEAARKIVAEIMAAEI